MNIFDTHISMRRWVARLQAMSAVVFTLFTACGCMRIHYEFEEKHLMRPSKTLFIGKRFCEEFNGYFSPLGYVLLPGELLADVVLMPMELFRRACYVIDPPLNEYIHQNDLEGLERRLQNGVDPNHVSTRHSYGLPPVVYAKDVECNFAAMKILVEHGAKITPEFFGSFQPRHLEMVRFVFDNGLADGIDFRKDTKGIVMGWLRCIDSSRHQEDVDAVAEGVALLLEHGASPNDFDKRELHGTTTPLDYLKSPQLVLFDFSRLVEVLRAHGAMTYEELLKSNNELPRLEIKGNAHPMFTHVVENLSKPQNANNLLVSTAYEGVEGPLLVIDMRAPERDASKEAQLFRKNVIVHRRESPTAWRQEGELFDVPIGCRMVLTPPGRKVPSRLKDGLPKGCIIRESWITLPEYEVYVEQPSPSHYNVGGGILGLSYEMRQEFEKQDEKYGRGGYRLEDSLLSKIIKTVATDDDPPSGQAKWMKNAQALLNQNGITGRWLPVKNDIGGFQYYLFSSRRTAEEIAKEASGIVPYPDEIIIHVWQHLNAAPNRNELHETSPDGKNGSAYWNLHYHSLGKGASHPGSVHIYYGDEVPEETVVKIWELLKTVL